MMAYLTTCVLCWTLALLYYLQGGSVQSNYYPLFSLTFMWIPGLVALVLARRERLRLKIFRKPNIYYVFAALTPLLIGAATTVISMPFGVEKSLIGMKETLFSLDPLNYEMPSPETPLGAGLLGASALIAVFMYVFAALGEELFWRGYLWEKVKGMGFWRGSLLIGFGWGIWHWPIISMGHNYPGSPYVGNVMMTAFAVLASPLITYYTLKAGSVMGAAIFHGFMNIAAAAAFILFVSPNELFLDVEGLAGLFVLLGANLWLYCRLPGVLADSRYSL